MEYKILNEINYPEDVKKLSIKEMEVLADELRDFIIHNVSVTGGHIAPSLGAVEISIATLFLFNPPKDKIVWDVGHQSYAYKIMTGRKEKFHTLRQYEGISGFNNIFESKYDALTVGHTSTSVSASLGMATARDLKKENNYVVAVIGDGALTAGMAFEALNQAGYLHKNLIIILNDNKMSISENVGGFSQYLNKIITRPGYINLRNEVWDIVGKLPSYLGRKGKEVVRKLTENLKNLMVPTILFDELGLHYVGPINGHDIKELITTLEAVKKLEGPVIIHTLTQKGKGFAPAENDPTTFHGLGSFDKITGEKKKKGDIPSYTSVFAKTIVQIAEEKENIVGITAAMPDGTGMAKLKDAFPDRFFDVGIAEQHAVTFAAGLALEGIKPIVAIYSTFLQRAYDQIIHDVALQKLPVVFAIDRGGVVGEDGPTHHGVFDMAYLRIIPNMIVSAPKDENELRHLLYTASLYKDGPFALRYPRGSGVGVKLDEKLHTIEIGKGEVFFENGKDVGILAIGAMVHPSKEASLLLEKEGIGSTVYNMRFIKPLDTQLIDKAFRKHKHLVIIEEGTLMGGFSSGVLEYLADKHGKIRKPILRIGIKDSFVTQGARNLLLELLQLDAKGIKAQIMGFLGDKNDK